MVIKVNQQVQKIIMLILFSGLSLGTWCPGDIWQKKYGRNSDDRGYSIVQMEDDLYIVGGQTNSFGAGGFDVYLLKIDWGKDSILWDEAIGGEKDDWCKSICLTPKGDYLIVGSTASYGAGGYDVYLVKVTRDGELEWTKTYGGSGDDFGHEVIVTRDGGYLVVGSTRSYGAGGEDVYLLKLDGNGDTVWVRVLGGAGDDCGYGVVQGSDGSYVVVGSTTSEGSGGKDVYLVKVSEHGVLKWTKTFGGASDDEGYGICVTPDGKYIFVGCTKSYSPISQVYLAKVDSLGIEQWAKIVGGDYAMYAYSIVRRAKGEYAIVGSVVPSDLNSDVLLILVEEDSGVEDVIYLGGENVDEAFSLRETSYGTIIIVGYTISCSSGEDVYLVEYP